METHSGSSFWALRQDLCSRPPWTMAAISLTIRWPASWPGGLRSGFLPPFLVKNVGIENPFRNEMGSNFLGPFHAFSNTAVCPNQLIIAVHPSHVLVLVIDHLKSLNVVAMSVPLSSFNNVCLVHGRQEIDFFLIIKSDCKHITFPPESMLTFLELWFL